MNVYLFATGSLILGLGIAAAVARVVQFITQHRPTRREMMIESSSLRVRMLVEQAKSRELSQKEMNSLIGTTMTYIMNARSKRNAKIASRKVGDIIGGEFGRSFSNESEIVLQERFDK